MSGSDIESKITSQKLILKKSCYFITFEHFCHITIVNFNPQALVAQKTADEVVFRHFQGEGVEFFQIRPH